MRSSESSYFYKEHPKTCAPDDFWAQVKRTVNGKPVGEDQIQLIVDAILDGLQICESDTLLDLCCGNGALSDRIFARCRGGLGVDYSDTLIAVAKQYFQSPQCIYRMDDAEAFGRSANDTARFTKALCYGAFQYLPRASAENVLEFVQLRFPRVERLFIGNLPDKALIDIFFQGRERAAGIENDPGSPIGIWRSEAEFAALALVHGWNTEFRRMPSSFYAAAYRYDVVLTRGAR